MNRRDLLGITAAAVSEVSPRIRFQRKQKLHRLSGIAKQTSRDRRGGDGSSRRDYCAGSQIVCDTRQGRERHRWPCDHQRRQRSARRRHQRQKKHGIEDSPDLLFRDLTDWSVVSPTAFRTTATTTARSFRFCRQQRTDFEWLVAHGVIFVEKAPDEIGGM